MWCPKVGSLSWMLLLLHYINKEERGVAHSAVEILYLIYLPTYVAAFTAVSFRYSSLESSRYLMYFLLIDCIAFLNNMLLCYFSCFGICMCGYWRMLIYWLLFFSTHHPHDNAALFCIQCVHVVGYWFWYLSFINIVPFPATPSVRYFPFLLLRLCRG